MKLSDTWLAFTLGIVLFLFIHIQPSEPLPDVIQIAGLFDKGDIKQEVVFRYAVDRVNAEGLLGYRKQLNARREKIPTHDSFYAHKSVCSIMGAGIMAIFGPQSPRTSNHVQSICDALEIPHLETRWDFKTKRDDYSINLFPHPSSLGRAYLDLVRMFNWTSFYMVYEEESGLIQLQDILRYSKKNEFKIFYLKLPKTTELRSSLNIIKEKGETNILVDCKTENIFRVLKQAQQIGMMTDRHNYILTTLDIHLVPLEDFRYAGTNITAMRIIDSRQDVHNLMQDWEAGRNLYTNKLTEEDQIMKTETALMYDAVMMFVKTLKDLDYSSDLHMASSDCERESSWVYGNSFINFMKTMNMTGVTGLIKFDTSGFRTDFNLDIIELRSLSMRKLGSWNIMSGINLTRHDEDPSIDKKEGIANKTLIVSIAFNDPYIMLAESKHQLHGNARYEGFCVDLLYEASQLLNFNYILEPVPENVYGGIDKTTGEWTGMIKELRENRADLAMTDLTISYERQQGVDFTMPFMNLGISIMYVKPKKAPPSLFSFLSPLSVEVWIYMMAAFVGVSLLMYGLSRLSPYEWQNPHPCNSDPECLENQFTLKNCFWFSIGSLMQQGCDFLPQAVSTRLVAGMWWFFTLIMISSYTANLAAFLTIEQLETPIESVEDLARQSKIKYGTKKSGTTKDFFQNSNMDIYQRMWQTMSSDQTVFVDSNQDGVDRVKKDNGLYAYFMESTSIEYTTERECSLTQVGGMLDSKSYGIAVRRNSPYKGYLDEALLTLQEGGRFHVLKNKWFRQQRGGGKCKEEASGGGGASELNLSNVGGVFVVMLAGMGLATVVAIVEFLLECWDITSDEGTPFLQVLKKELTFVFKCKGSSKPVRKKPESESDEADDYGSTDYNYTAKNPLT